MASRDGLKIRLRKAEYVSLRYEKKDVIFAEKNCGLVSIYVTKTKYGTLTAPRRTPQNVAECGRDYVVLEKLGRPKSRLNRGG
jgi:hypothetical protein